MQQMFTIAILPQNRVFYARRLRPVLVDPADVTQHRHTVVVLTKQNGPFEQRESRFRLHNDPKLVEHAVCCRPVLHKFPEVQPRVDDDFPAGHDHVRPDDFGQAQVAAEVRVLMLQESVDGGYQSGSCFLRSRVWKERWIYLRLVASISKVIVRFTYNFNKYLLKCSKSRVVLFFNQ